MSTKNKQDTSGGRLRRLVRWLRRCRHEWAISATNGFGMVSEEMCMKCYEFRHRVLIAKSLYEDPEWKPGRHPKSK